MKRFKKTYSQGTVNVTEIWVDTETGINYLLSEWIGRSEKVYETERRQR